MEEKREEEPVKKGWRKKEINKEGKEKGMGKGGIRQRRFDRSKS